MSDDARAEYRKHLIDLEQRAQAEYDKTVVSLAGGALGVSFAFVKDFTVPGPAEATPLLVGAWISWATSIACILISHYLSTLSMRKAIQQVDSGALSNEEPGGVYSIATAVFNAFGGLAFIVGVVSMGLFVAKNVR